MKLNHVAGPIARLWHGIDHALAARATRRDLEQLDDRMLKDLGISRAQAMFEAHRGQWPMRGHR